MKRFSVLFLLASLFWASLILPASALAQSAPLIVVEDHGGASALTYYRALNLQGENPTSTPGTEAVVVGSPTTTPPKAPYAESDLLPVRSSLLTPGAVTPRAIQAPGLTPLFVIGDDEDSRRWLKAHLARLQRLETVGLVVHVESRQALQMLRALAPGLTLSPTSGDDLARRLHIEHYPVLITATRIEP